MRTQNNYPVHASGDQKSLIEGNVGEREEGRLGGEDGSFDETDVAKNYEWALERKNIEKSESLRYVTYHTPSTFTPPYNTPHALSK